jgi:hypothetical protein
MIKVKEQNGERYIYIYTYFLVHSFVRFDCLHKNLYLHISIIKIIILHINIYSTS